MTIEEIKLMMGEAAAAYTDAQIGLAVKMALAEVEAYCNRTVDYELEIIAIRIALIKLNRINTEGLATQSYNGISESYIDGYPAEIAAVLKAKRKIKVM